MQDKIPMMWILEKKNMRFEFVMRVSQNADCFGWSCAQQQISLHSPCHRTKDNILTVFRYWCCNFKWCIVVDLMALCNLLFCRFRFTTNAVWRVLRYDWRISKRSGSCILVVVLHVKFGLSFLHWITCKNIYIDRFKFLRWNLHCVPRAPVREV